MPLSPCTPTFVPRCTELHTPVAPRKRLRVDSLSALDAHGSENFDTTCPVARVLFDTKDSVQSLSSPCLPQHGCMESGTPDAPRKRRRISSPAQLSKRYNVTFETPLPISRALFNTEDDNMPLSPRTPLSVCTKPCTPDAPRKRQRFTSPVTVFGGDVALSEAPLPIARTLFTTPLSSETKAYQADKVDHLSESSRLTIELESAPSSPAGDDASLSLQWVIFLSPSNLRISLYTI